MIFVPLHVQILHLPFFDLGLFKLLAGSKRALKHVARPKVAHLGPHEGAALPGFDVLIVDDFHRHAFQPQFQSIAKISCGNHDPVSSGNNRWAWKPNQAVGWGPTLRPRRYWTAA